MWVTSKHNTLLDVLRLDQVVGHRLGSREEGDNTFKGLCSQEQEGENKQMTQEEPTKASY